MTISTERVNNLLNKLSDRDTLSLATAELDSIARTLSSDSITPFLTCVLSTATTSHPSAAVRRHTIRVIGVIPPSALSLYQINRILPHLLRRLRDTDSSVRQALINTVSSLSPHVSPLTALANPFAEALFTEQEARAVEAAAMCVLAAVEGGSAAETREMDVKKLVGRAVRMLGRSDCKAKAGVLGMVGGCVGRGGWSSGGRGLVGCVVDAAVNCLGNEEWAVRKAAAEVLEKVADNGGEAVVTEFKTVCAAALESRRFDKVKIVRETMNRALETWRNVPEDASPSSVELLSSPKDSISGEHSSIASSHEVGFHIPKPRKITPLRSSPASSNSSTTSSQKSTITYEDKTPCSAKLKFRRNPGLSRSRVVPFDENLSHVPDHRDNYLADQKESDDISLIRKQLQQIEKQQSNLLDLLQRFMGSSQKGMSSLEKRVDGLEKVIDEMSQDFANSSRRFASEGIDPSSANACCTEFLSPKFWKKTDNGQITNARFCTSFRNKSVVPHKGTSFEISKQA